MNFQKLNAPWFLFLFPLFFVFHGFAENFFFVSVKSALFLVLVYTSFSFLLTGLFYIFSRNLSHASVMAACVMAFHFFFGPMHDAIRQVAGALFSRYSVVIGFFAILLVCIYLFLRKKQLLRFIIYLNLLFILLIAIDGIRLFGNADKAAPPAKKGWQGLTVCDTCLRPDIHIIILDGYAGRRQLTDLFRFDNTPFYEQLELRGFKVIKESNSNYDSSPTSVASTLNMEYLDSAETKRMRKTGHRYAFLEINNNRLAGFLQSNGYKVFNHSVFKFAGEASPTGNSFIPANAKLVNGNTFMSRMEKDVFINLATKLNFKPYLRKFMYATGKDNETVYNLTSQLKSTGNEKPKFVYTHLMMPHHPYYFKETGEPYSFQELSGMPYSDTAAYISYLKYTNRKVLQLIDSIIAHSASPPLITLLSDHGFRYFREGNYGDYAFSNLLSVKLPSGNYSQFRDTMTNVNFLRVVMNSQFGTRLPMLKDSTSIIEF